MKKNYIIIHGSFGSPFINWYEWLSDELVKKNKSVYVPHFPVGINLQNYNNWSKILKCYLDLKLINKNTIIIGHSIAPIFITKFLIENKVKVAKLIFVAGFNNYFLGNEDYDAVNKSFFTENIKRIHNYCNNITCVFSDNDPYLPLNILEEFANKVADESILIEKGGHLNSESGYDQFEEILELIER